MVSQVHFLITTVKALRHERTKEINEANDDTKFLEIFWFL